MAGKIRKREFEEHGEVSWCPLDIKELKPRWNYEKENMVAEGWNTIEYYIDQDPWM